ncbi:hypothetical protein DNC80_15490 [Flavobacterium sp. SOK18b]|uniref:hypothetical protein n=1 Tax=Flavobacterium sp. SOK18b TaxID=797900 RepID=UPI0015FA028C|nr:hypothetical protein [Flavobacterium sp. SOK18b]MBB1195068.1 hypothetical protein [Flavobacterium sp. SOK18b]
MRTALYYFFSLLLILLLSSIFLVSCKTKQPLIEKNETTFVSRDSINNFHIISNNKAIHDSLVVVIGKIKTEKKECDSVCQISVDKLLSQLNSKKTSGDNSSDVFYDPDKNTLNVNTHVGATKNDSVRFTKIIYITKIVYSHKDIPIDKPLSKWQLTLIIIGAITLGYLFFKITMLVKSKFLV